ncbi:MAG: hypothetical protein M1832_006259 [Thelocarpon impressellum]|nr:MAG: hypothetical protein M1832_006259 [Thelocarpon impressellum]
MGPIQVNKACLGLAFLIVTFFLAVQATEPQQTVIKDHPAKRVAIIGAGSAGASAAYYLRRFSAESGHDVDISVFERSSYVGGRSTTVNVYDDPNQVAELGASIFVRANKNLVSAVINFSLPINDFSTSRPREAPDRLGVWNGEEFVFTQSEGSWYWWNIAKLLWKYGLAPVRSQNLMKATVKKFLSMYEAPQFPFSSLSDVVHDVGLASATAATGEQFLQQNSIVPPFSTDIVQASTRVNYAQNLALIHGLETMVCMATEGAMSVDGGNWQIFDRMVDASDGRLWLNTSVSSIEKAQDQYEVHFNGTSRASEAFDEVILAAPYHQSNIAIPGLATPPDDIPYVELHVTLFTSPHRLSPSFFNLPPGVVVPEVVLTTLHPDDAPGSSRNGVGRAGFLSISTLRTVHNPSGTDDQSGREYLYKIFSPTPPSVSSLCALLGLSSHPVPSADISWLHRKTWLSYPYLYPRVTFEDIRLANGLWYTAGIESFISTMETSSLMGMNVARLVVDGWGGGTGTSGGEKSPREEEL